MSLILIHHLKFESAFSIFKNLDRNLTQKQAIINNDALKNVLLFDFKL